MEHTTGINDAMENDELRIKLENIAKLEQDNSLIGASFSVKDEYTATLHGDDTLLTSDVVDHVAGVVSIAVDMINRKDSIPLMS